MFRCRLCDRQFSEIPSGAILVRNGRHYKMYKFDGQLHDLGLIKPTHQEQVRRVGSSGIGPHVSKHVNRGIRKRGCKFCEGGTEATPEPAHAEEQ